MTSARALSRYLDRHWLAVALFAGAASTGMAPAADGDLWWHLAAGREMVSRGGLLFTDPFSVSAAGRPWIDVHWLFQLMLYGVHYWLGLAGLVWVKCAVLGVGALLLLSALGRDQLAPWARPLFVTLLLAALFATRSLLLVRPVLVTLVCLALFFRNLERFRADGGTRHLWWLVPLQIAWANCQALSALGPAVVAAYAAAAASSAWLGRRAWWPFAREPGAGSWLRPQQLGLAGAACLLGLTITPFGLHGPALSTALLQRLMPGAHNVYAHNIAENVPPFLLEQWSGGELWHLKWFFLLLGFSLVVGGRRLNGSHALLLLLFTVLALLGNRNVLLLYWIATPIAALHLAPAARRVAGKLGGQSGAGWVLAANAAVLTAVLATSVWAATRETDLAAPSPFRVPAESAERLASLPGADVFSADHHGGYLIWRLYPKFRPYIDTRLVLRRADEYADYLGLADFPERFAEFQARRHFGYVVLPVAYPNRYLALIGALYRSPDWRLIFTNGSEVLFARRDLAQAPAQDLGSSATTERLVARLAAQFRGQPKLLGAARQHLAMLELSVGEPAQAERALLGVLGAESEELRARCRFVSGDLDGAEVAVRRVLAKRNGDAASLSILAQVALVRGDAARSLGFVRRALQADAFNAEASQILANLQEESP